MKRIIAIVLSGAMMLSMTSCAAVEFVSDVLGFTNAYEVYETAMDKYNSMKSNDIEIKINLITESLNTVQTVPTTMLMQTDNDSENPVYYMYSSSELMGSESYQSFYYTEGRMYVDYNGTKYYTDMDVSEAQQDAAVGEENLLDFTAEMFANVPVKRADGLRVIEISFSGEAMRDQLIELTGIETSVDLATDTDAIVISTSNALFKINSEGYLVNYGLEFTLDYKYNWTNSNGEELISDAKLTFDMLMTVRNPGQKVEIDVPDDLGTYVEGFNSEYADKYDMTQITEDEYTALAALLFDENDIPVENFAEIIEQERENYSENLINYMLYLKDFYDYYYGDVEIEDTEDTASTEDTEDTQTTDDETDTSEEVTD